MNGKSNRGLQLIAIFKLIKGTMLVLLALGAFHLLHKDVGDVLQGWVKEARFDPENKHLAGLLAKADLVDDHKLKELGSLTLVYAALFLTEGIGLLCHQRWAEYLTVIATASLIPLEGYEVCHHTTVVKIALLIINIIVVAYLIYVLRKGGAEARSNG